MNSQKLKNIIVNNGGEDKVKMFTLMNGGTVVYADILFKFDDLNMNENLLYVKGRNDTRGQGYTLIVDVSQIISVAMMNDVTADRGDSYAIRG